MKDDKDLKNKEQEKRGRTGKDADTKMLGKRQRSNRNTDDIDMDGSDESDKEGEMARGLRGSLGKNPRSMTPTQRQLSVKKIIRDRTASRREGSQPKRLDFKPVPDEHVRLAKKINSVFKHKIQRSEADREVTCKMPKHLFAGKMSNGAKAYR